MNGFEPLLIVAILLPAIVCGMFLPFFFPWNVVFGIVIPVEQGQDPEVRKLRHDYIFINGIIGAAIVAASIVGYGLHLANAVLFTLPSLLYAWAALILFVRFRGKAYRLKSAKEWFVPRSRSHIVDTRFRNGTWRRALTWFWLPLLMIMANVVLVAVRYDRIPAILNAHESLAGPSESIASKNPFVLFLPNGLQILVLLLTTLAQSIVIRARPQLSLEAPESSAIEEAKKRKTVSALLLAVCLVLICQFAIVQLSMIGILSALAVTIVSVVLHMALLPVVLIFSMKSGWRDRIDRTNRFHDDKYWKGGIFYYNPEDSSLFIEKRVGLGYAFNYAHPLSWLMTFAPFLLIFVLVAAAIYFAAGTK